MKTIFANPASYKWLSHYEKLIQKAKSRTLSGYFERHHIVPRCLGGTDDTTNLVDLTPEEHYVAHLMLVKIYPTNQKLIYAVAAMLMDSPTTPRKNKTYGWFKKRYSAMISTKMKEWHSENKHPMLGRKHSEEAKRKIGVAAAQNTKSVHCFDPSTGKYIESFQCVAEAALKYNVHTQTIFSCVRTDGKRTAAKRFWSYDKDATFAPTKLTKRGISYKLLSDKTKRCAWNGSAVKSNPSAKLSWLLAGEIFEAIQQDPNATCGQISRLFPNLNPYQGAKGPYIKIKHGWNPLLDQEWTTWKDSQK